MSAVKLVYLVDDDADDHEIFTSVLKDVDGTIRCESVFDCHEALVKLEISEQHPDIIFLDLNMPRMNGKQCLSALKQNAKLKSIPVVIYSTSSEPHDKSETAKLGAHDYIVKSFSFDLLAADIKRVIEHI